jgi:manganese efflux pump family protein
VNFLSILLLAVALAADATAVAAARGVTVTRITPRHVLLVASFFGGFQALMPLLGYLLGSRIGPTLEAWDHWIAFGLLGFIGGKMLWEARGPRDAPSSDHDPFGLRVLFLLAIATSIDAFAVGITLPMLGAPFALSLATIGVVTALLSALGLWVGRRFGALFGTRLELAGGVVLIALGTKILVEHLFGA